LRECGIRKKSGDAQKRKSPDHETVRARNVFDNRWKSHRGGRRGDKKDDANE